MYQNEIKLRKIVSSGKVVLQDGDGDGNMDMLISHAGAENENILINSKDDGQFDTWHNKLGHYVREEKPESFLDKLKSFLFD